MNRLLAVLYCCPLGAAQVWTVLLEEPTGLYRRTREIVGVPLAKLGGVRGPFLVLDPGGSEVPWQVAGSELLFPASVTPGKPVEYRIAAAPGPAPRFESNILLRRAGMHRVELGNPRFRILLDAQSGAILEAYNRSAGPQRSLNLVETTPETRDPNDIHAGGPAYPPTGVDGPNAGWTSLGGSGPFERIEFLEAGPLRGRLLLGRAGESWEFTWTASGAWLSWRARRGFRFAAVSAAPFLPFDRCLGGAEDRWPSGPEAEQPPDSRIQPRPWSRLPGGHMVYYAREDNYGALGVLDLRDSLTFRGACSRRFQASAEGPAEVVLTFPQWQGDQTVLEARREYRMLKQPLLVRISGPAAGPLSRRVPAPREPESHQTAASTPPAAFAPEVFPLDGDWELAWGEKGAGPGSEWRTVRVPGSAHLQWLPAADLYTRRAEWVSSKEWWYRKRFRLPPGLRGKPLRLQFDATDYYAEVWLNGAWIGRHEGYVDPWELNVRAEPENLLQVRVWTPVHYYWRHRPYTIKGSYGAVDQKPDNITALGITRGVRLVADTGARIRDVAVDTRLTATGAEVEVSLDSAGSRNWELTLRPRNFTSPESYRIRGRGSRFAFRIPNPRLWWTWDHGKPHLYTLDLRLLDNAGRVLDGRSLPVGIREIEKQGWIFYLNRRRLFLRGTNLYYNLFLSEMDHAAYQRDLKLILGMNVNTIRLHCHFSNPEFYDLADELGILVWQDFLEAWYPHDRDFSLHAAALYDNHIRYARNHPSVALWATSDEEDLENYRDLTKHLAARLAFLDPQRRPVVRSTGRFGDAHLYHGWYGGSIWEYARMREPFVSELGATALPAYESIQRFLPGRWPIRDHAADWTFHKLQIPEAMRAWGDPGERSLKEYIPHTQAYASRLFQLALERARRLKYQPAGGILHFHAIDIWPSITMAAVDFYRVPTEVYHAVRRSFEPAALLFEYDRDTWQAGEEMSVGLWAVNDRFVPIRGAAAHWEILDAAGQQQASGRFGVALPEDSVSRIHTLRWHPQTPGEYVLTASLLESNNRLVSKNLYSFRATSAGPSP